MVLQLMNNTGYECLDNLLKGRSTALLPRFKSYPCGHRLQMTSFVWSVKLQNLNQQGKKTQNKSSEDVKKISKTFIECSWDVWEFKDLMSVLRDYFWNHNEFNCGL